MVKKGSSSPICIFLNMIYVINVNIYKSEPNNRKSIKSWESLKFTIYNLMIFLIFDDLNLKNLCSKVTPFLNIFKLDLINLN